jgi:hypothetical protein
LAAETNAAGSPARRRMPAISIERRQSVSPCSSIARRTRASGGELPQVVVEPSTGFAWSDAGIGAGMAVGLMLLALGAALATRHASRKALAGA